MLGRIAWIVAFLWLVSVTRHGMAEEGVVEPPEPPHPGAVASAHPLATEAGIQILRAGGNAFDAAVAVAATLGVVEPYSAGIGGGGFWLLRFGSDASYRFVDAREQAPAAAHRDMYLDDSGEPMERASLDGPLAAGIPGQAAAFAHISARYGKLPLTVTLQPAIETARNGFHVDQVYQRLAVYRASVLRAFPESKRIFLPSAIPLQGDRIVQPQLAETLYRLAEHGHEGFYGGVTARKLVDAVRAAGGIWTMADLAGYRVIERPPIEFTYRGRRVYSAPPPSSGGIALATIFNILALWDLDELGETERTHLLVEAMRRAYRDRALFLGDPDHYPVPSALLTSREHAIRLASDIRMDRASKSVLPVSGFAPTATGTHTTHLSVLDANGNAVSATLSINLPFGSGFTASGTGVLLNNEMDDFSVRPGTPNAYGLVGAAANAIAPGKRPLSSMSPTIIEGGSETAILGTPGGSRIITMVLLGALEHFDDEPPESWVGRERFHHQYLPDAIQHEPDAFAATVRAGLRRRGHRLRSVGRTYGNMQAILWRRTRGEVEAASDPRGIGAAAVE